MLEIKFLASYSQAKASNIFVDLAKQKKFIRMISASVICILLPLIFVPFAASAGNFELSPIQLNSHAYQLLYNYFYTVQFASAAFAVRERFHLLNDFLRFEFADYVPSDSHDFSFIQFFTKL